MNICQIFDTSQLLTKPLWRGNNIPKQVDDERKVNFTCFTAEKYQNNSMPINQSNNAQQLKIRGVDNGWYEM